MQPDRRQVLGMGGAILAAGAGLVPRRANAATKITVLNWQGYGTDEKWATDAFTKAHGIEVVHDYFNAESEMLTKLHTNPGTYDVVLFNTARIKQATADGLLDAIDLATIPNAASLAPKLANNSNIVENGKPYGVAWLWGMNALAQREGRPVPDSFKALADPANAGKVALYDDAVTNIAVGALIGGQDMNDPKNLDEIKAWLKTLKPNVKTIWTSEDQWDKAFAANEFELSVFWSGATVRAKRNFKLPAEFVVPKEGAVGWLDALTIPTTSTNKEAAKTFINYMIDPAFYVEWATKVGAPASANAAAMATLPADDLNRRVHDPKYLDTMTIMAPLSDEKRDTFTNLWQEVKAFYAG